jgi:hypothetical protein
MVIAAMMGCALGATGATARAESPPGSGPPLRVDSDDGRASLFRIDPEIWVVSAASGRTPVPRTVERWTRVCDAPCNTAVDRNGLFRIAGAGLTASETFSLQENVTSLRVNAGSSGLLTAGLFGAALGGGLTVSGLMLLAMHHTMPAPTVPPPSFDMGKVGWGLLLTGGPLLIAGTVTALANGTTVEPSSGP